MGQVFIDYQVKEAVVIPYCSLSVAEAVNIREFIENCAFSLYCFLILVFKFPPLAVILNIPTFTMSYNT